MPKLSWLQLVFRKAAAALRQCKRQIYSTTDLRVYGICLTEVGVASSNGPVFCRDSWKDLEAFDPHHGWVTADVFLADAKKRLTNGEHAYTLVENGRLVHYGWSVAPVERRYIPDVDQFAEFPGRSVYLYDFFTHPDSRNKGVYRNSLRHILRELASTTTFEQAFIGVESGNIPSRRVIEKIGFTYRFSLYRRWCFFRVRRWLVKPQSYNWNSCSGSSLQSRASPELKT